MPVDQDTNKTIKNNEPKVEEDEEKRQLSSRHNVDIILTSPVRYLGPWPHVPVRLLPPSGPEVSVHRSRSPPPAALAEMQASTVAGPHYCKLGKHSRAEYANVIQVSSLCQLCALSAFPVDYLSPAGRCRNRAEGFWPGTLGRP